MGAFDFLQPNQQLQPIGVGPLALTPPLPKAQNNVTALNPPAPKPPPYVTGVDLANAASNMSAVQSENALRQQQAAQTGMNTQLLAAQLKAMPEFMAMVKAAGGGGAAPAPTGGAPSASPSSPPSDGTTPATSDTDQAAALVKKYESDGDYNVGYGGADLSKAPARDGYFGFPDWAGAKGPQGTTHAAGAYQFEPDTWKALAPAAGVTDFSPASQDKVFQLAYQKSGFAPWAPFNPKLAAAIGQRQQGGNSAAPASLAAPGAGANTPAPGAPTPPAPDASAINTPIQFPNGQRGAVSSALAPNLSAQLPVTPAARAIAASMTNAGAPNGAPQAAAPSPPGASSPGGAVDPMALAKLGAMAQLYRFPDVATPLLQAFYNSPTYLKAKIAAEGQGALPTQVDLANATANAQLRKDLAAAGMTFGPNNTIVPIPGFNQAKAGTEGAVAAAKAQAVPQDLRQGGVLTQYNPATKQYEVVAQAPRLPEGTSLGTGPDGKPVAEEVPGAIPAIQKAQAAVEAGKAQIQPLQEQNEALSKEYETNVVEPFNHAQSAIAPLTAVQNAQQNYQTGPGAETKLQLLKAWQSFASSVNLPPNSDLAQEISSGEIIKKEGTQLGFELARSLGSRESQMVIQQAIASNPGLANSPQGNQQLISLIRQGLQRDLDKRSFVDDWMQKNRTFAGATDAFNKTHPVEVYVSQAVPYQPKTEADYSALPGGVRYFNPHTNSLKVKPLDAAANHPAQ